MIIYRISMNAEMNIIVIKQSKFKNVNGLQPSMHTYLHALFAIMLLSIFTFSPQAKIRYLHDVAYFFFTYCIEREFD